MIFLYKLNLFLKNKKYLFFIRFLIYVTLHNIFLFYSINFIHMSIFIINFHEMFLSNFNPHNFFIYNIFNLMNQITRV